MKPAELVVPWLPFGAQAMTWWPLILYTREAWKDPCIHAHEKWHWDSQGKWGPLWPLTWGLLYQFWNVVTLLKRESVTWHPMERKAYKIYEECKNA